MNENFSFEDLDFFDFFGFFIDGIYFWYGERFDFDGKWINDDSDVIW